MSFKLQARVRHLSGTCCEPYSSANFQDLNSVQPRLVASVMHIGSAWKTHRMLQKTWGLFWGTIQVGIADEMHLPWARYWTGSHLAENFFSRLRSPVWYVAELQKWLNLYQGETTQISFSSRAAFHRPVCVSSLGLSWIYYSSLSLPERWRVGVLSWLLFGI